MSRFWSIDSPLMNGLGTIADIFLLNIMYVICCIPVVTIGAATSALYTVTMQITRNEYPAVTKVFFKAFKRNFKISTICWLVFMAVGFLLWFDFQIIGQIDGAARSAAKIALGAVLVIYIMVLTYVFPYIARFENDIKNTFKNAFVMSVAHFPFTLILAGLTIGLAVLTFFSGRTFAIATLAFFFIGFGLLAYVKSKLFIKVFGRYE